MSLPPSLGNVCKQVKTEQNQKKNITKQRGSELFQSKYRLRDKYLLYL